MVFEILVAVLLAMPVFLLGILLGYRATNKGFVQRVKMAKKYAADLTAISDERISPRTEKAVKFALDTMEEELR